MDNFIDPANATPGIGRAFERAVERIAARFEDDTEGEVGDEYVVTVNYHFIRGEGRAMTVETTVSEKPPRSKRSRNHGKLAGATFAVEDLDDRDQTPMFPRKVKDQ